MTTTAQATALSQIPRDLLDELQTVDYAKGAAVRFSPGPIGKLVTGTYIKRTSRGHQVDWSGHKLLVTYVVPVV
jgi:hypothetical protein